METLTLGSLSSSTPRAGAGGKGQQAQEQAQAESFFGKYAQKLKDLDKKAGLGDRKV